MILLNKEGHSADSPSAYRRPPCSEHVCLVKEQIWRTTSMDSVRDVQQSTESWHAVIVAVRLVMKEWLEKSQCALSFGHGCSVVGWGFGKFLCRIGREPNIVA
ncbi:hypothetical protein B5X24_HaOG205347 [Helicoverpa armigera]|uniref:Uncharacterized protein n=1 Tax=Helicoverpa armigera TaxID=29058 RepID=A0A2W1BQM5_HELAM|nr:hypothetical protein B5X24_HaOG205347 [Helicoverpa armigera]